MLPSTAAWCPRVLWLKDRTCVVVTLSSGSWRTISTCLASGRRRKCDPYLLKNHGMGSCCCIIDIVCVVCFWFGLLTFLLLLKLQLST